MALLDLVVSRWALVVIVAAVLFFYLFPYFMTYKHLRAIPAPFPAQFSDLWLLSTARRGKRYALVDEAHRQLGPVVRIAPNHVSINDDEAIQIVYGHGNGYVKSSFYDAFVSIKRGLFNTRDRAEHTRKRKIVSHTFSAKSVGQFEPYIHNNLALFVRQWDALIQQSARARSRADGGGGAAAAAAHLDCLKWFNYLAFDIIGDLAFGAPFGMLAAGADIAEVRSHPDSPPVFAPAIQILNRRGEVSATLGCLPELKPYAKWLPDPFFRHGLRAVENLAGIAVARVKARLDHPPAVRRKDLLEHLMHGRDDKGEPLGREELTAEALTQLIAGSDTTSNSSCALLFHVVRTPGVLAQLQRELDRAIPNAEDDEDVPTYDKVRDLPYLQAVLHEGLRLHSTSGIGLPRQIPDDAPGLHLHGYYFPPGSVLSVPTYSVHHAKDIWGPDADAFRPERWETLTARQKNAFIPFSYGPRSCVGRNVAEMEMKLILATWVRRYDVTLLQDEMETREGFLRKPLELNIRITKRKGIA
ncbi:Cytochrome P450 [Niveomyces insectorum RCEF 264]|uniref:Benzoate 4-monooxygenase bphA n=1 Tax=Niveomyces insectorum RCEF 264 TaxID=1081102 RepID=A0A167W579_9HYPO|nr:Cytochrome P450 [Niveomyces insectorum RCEF 264]